MPLRGKKVTEDYVSETFARRTMVLSPEDRDQDQDKDYDGKVEASHRTFQLIPMLAEQVSGGGDGGYPYGSAEDIEQGEGSPGHAEDTCEGSGKDPQAENETGEKN